MDENMKVGLVVGIPAALAAIVLAASMGGRAQPPPDCLNGEVQSDVCPDGSTFVAMECMNGVWVPTGYTCPPPPVIPPELINEGTLQFIRLTDLGTGEMLYEYCHKRTGAIISLTIPVVNVTYFLSNHYSNNVIGTTAYNNALAQFALWGYI